MQCPLCGHSNPDDAEFCGNCGNRIDGEKDIFDVYDSIKGTVSTLFGNRARSSWNEGTANVAQGGNDNFVSPDETVQATIGVSYIQSLMSGADFKNGAAILTDKRLYYFGRSFSNIGKGVNTATEEGVISVDEITFTRLFTEALYRILLWLSPFSCQELYSLDVVLVQQTSLRGLLAQ